MNRIRCFSEDCVNFRKAGWIFGGECGSSEIVVSSGTGACLTKVPRSEVEKPTERIIWRESDLP